MKRFLLLMLCLVFLSSMVSAADFDNVGRYHEDTRTMEIINAFGLGAPVANITLLSPLNVDVFPGEERLVAWYQIDNFGDYDGESIFSVVDTFNTRRGNSQIVKNIVHKKQSVDTITRTKYSTACLTNETGYHCISSPDGTEEVEVIEWTGFNTNSDLLAGTEIIGLFTEVEYGEKIEWIPEMFGIRIEEWATWGATLGDGIKLFYAFNESAGNNAFDSTKAVPDMNGTRVNMEDADWVTGFIGNGLNFSSTDGIERVVSANTIDITGSNNRSVFAWINVSSNANANGIVSWGSGGGSEATLAKLPTGRITFDAVGVSLSVFDQIEDNKWTFVGYTAQRHGSVAEIRLYVNNTRVGIANLTITTANDVVDIGRASATASWEYSGIIDEVGIWNRTLTQSEIDELYNDGDGLTFGEGPEALDVTLIQPSDTAILLSGNEQIFNATFSITGAGDLINSTLFIYNSSGVLVNKTFKNVTGSPNNSSFFNLTIPSVIDTFTWNVQACETAVSVGCLFAGSNFTFTSSFFTENNQTFNVSVIETSNQEYSINLTTNEAGLALSGTLFYNGTSFPGTVTQETSSVFVISRNIDVPLVEVNDTILDFFWEIKTVGDTTQAFNATTQFQNVSNVDLGLCDANAFSDNVFNFTAANERNLSVIDPFLFDSTLDFYLGTGTTRENSTFSFPSVSSVGLCVSPVNASIKVSGTVAYDGVTNGTFVAREFNFQDDPTDPFNVNITLFLLPTEFSTSFIIFVQDQTLIEVPQALVDIQKFFPGLNLFQTVQRIITDDLGKSIAFFETEVVDYRFVVTVNGSIELTTSKAKVFGEQEPFTITLTIGEEITNPVAAFDDITFLVATLEFLDVSDTVLFTYTDTSGNFTEARLLVEQFQPDRNDIVICNFTSASSTSSISCDIGGLNGTFIAQGFIERSPETLVDAITFIVTSAREIFGENGLFLSVFILLAAFFTFIWNPTVGVIAVNITLIFINIIGIATFSPIYTFSLMAISILLLMFLRS